MVSEPVPALLSTSEAAAHVGISQPTIRRRVDAWLRGDRSPYALKGGRTGGSKGDRSVDPVDAERARLQRVGELPSTVTTEEYARARRDAST